MTRTMTRDHYAKHGPKSSHVRCSLKGLTVRRDRVFRVIPSSQQKFKDDHSTCGYCCAAPLLRATLPG